MTIRYGSVCSGIEAATVAWHPLGWEPAWFSEIEAFPKEVLRHHYPHVPDLGDMTRIATAIRGGTVEAPDVLVGGTPCFTEDTVVLTKRGLLPINEVVPGDWAWTHQNRWRRVVASMSRLADTIVLKGQGHHGLETTMEHPFLAREKKSRTTRKNGKPIRKTWVEPPEWVDAYAMSGSFWATPSHINKIQMPKFKLRSSEGRNLPNGFDEDFFWFLGAWVGDGWLRTDQRSNRPKGQINGHVLLCGNKKDREFLEGKIAKTGLSASVANERTTVRFQISSKPLCRWIERHFGRYADGKKIPAWMFGAPEKIRNAFLDGYMFADGGRYTQPKGGGKLYRSASINRHLVVGLKMLYATLGRASTVVRCSPKRDLKIEGRKVKERPFYQLSVYDKSRSAFFADGFLWGKVRRVCKGRKKIRVYNIEVADDNSYVADGYVVHNCQAFSVAGLRRSLDDERGNLSLEYVRIADAIDDVRSVRGEQPVTTLWENVPGVLNTKDNAFGCLLGALAGEDVPMEPPGGRWKNAGCVFGPKRSICWRVLDAQFFGLAQRRRRVFVVSSAREGFRPQEILFEFEGGRGDTAPGREEGQGAAGPAQGGAGAGGANTYDLRGHGDGDTINALVGDHANRPTDYTPVVTHEPEPPRDTASTLTARYPGASHQWAPHNEADNLIPMKSVLPFDTTQVTSKYNYSHPKEGDPCHPLAAGAHPPAVAMGSETGQVAVDVRNGTLGDTSQTVQSGGASPSENTIPHVISLQDVGARDKAQNGRGWNDDGVSYTVDAAATQGVAFGADLSQKAEGIGFKEEQAPCVAPGTHPGHGTHAIVPMSGETGACMAFSSKDDGRDASEEVSPTLRAGAHDGSHANSGAPPAVVTEMEPLAFKAGQGPKARSLGIGENVSPTLTSEDSGNTRTPTVAFQACGARADPGVSCSEERAYTLPANPMSDRGQAVAFKSSHYTRGKDGAPSEVCPPPTKEADKGDQDPLVLAGDEPPARRVYQVRRLTARECERLQGFPDDYTRIPWRKKGAEDCPDGPRYKSLGNSMAVTVMAWIGRRIDAHLKGGTA